MWLFHSLVPDDMSPKCLRRQLLEYCLKPQVPEDGAGTQELALDELESAASSADRSRAPAPPPFESWLEVDVYLQLRRRGYRVLPKHSFVGYKIDLVVSGTQGRLAVQCDAQEWHGQDRYDTDMNRQRQLERCGWRFWRIRSGTFYRNPEAALQPLWDLLEKQGIRPRTDAPTAAQQPAPAPAEAKPVTRDADDESETPPARKPRRRTKSAHA
jgi:very-short-patch-repair endonuclease